MIDEAIHCLSSQSRELIDVWLQRYPANQKKSAILYALRVVQEENGGWLTNDLMNRVADYLDVPPVAVYEVATFYSMYDLKPVGCNKIKLCTSISCMLRGADKIVAHMRNRYGVEVNGTNPDGLFTFKAVECLAACDHAPVLQVNDKVCFGPITPEKIDLIISDLEKSDVQ